VILLSLFGTPRGSVFVYAAPVTVAPIEYPISDSYAKAFVLRTTGRADVVAAMVKRVPTPAVKETGPRFWTDLDRAIWGGYLSSQQGAFLHRVYGTYTDFYAQPAGGCCPTAGSWTGVGGFGNCGLAQAGVNSGSLMAFYEMLYPNPSGGCQGGSTPLFAVNGGDHMWSYITLDSGNGLWYFEVDDFNTGSYWSSEFSYHPDLTSAEWITELYGTSVPPGMPYVHFWGARWIDENFNGHTIVDGSYALYRITLRDPSGGCVVPSGLYGANDTFDNYPQPGSC
jgi:hypothetical protein